MHLVAYLDYWHVLHFVFASYLLATLGTEFKWYNENGMFSTTLTGTAEQTVIADIFSKPFFSLVLFSQSEYVSIPGNQALA